MAAIPLPAALPDRVPAERALSDRAPVELRTAEATARAARGDEADDVHPVLEDDGRFDFPAFGAMLRRNLSVIGATLALALLAGLIVTLLSTPRYIATASVQIDQESDRVLSTETQDVAPVASYSDIERFLQTQTDVLRSRAMAINVAQSLKFFGNTKFLEAMGDKPKANAVTIALPGIARERTIKLMSKNLTVALPRNSRIVNLSFESADPKLSADVANSYAKGYITANLQRKYNSSAYARDFLSGQLVEAKTKLEQSERELNGYARAAGLIATAPRPTSEGSTGTGSAPSVTSASLNQLNEAFNAAKSARIATEQKWRSASVTPIMSIPEVLANPAVQALVQQRALRQAALGEEQSRHRDDYPAVKEAVAQVRNLNEQISALAVSIRRSIQDQYTVSAAQEQSLERQVNGLKQDTLSEQDRSVRFNILSREVDTNRTLYDGLLQRFKELSAAAGIASNNISIIDTADVPLKPSSPQLLVNLSVALLIGAILAAAAVFVREQIDDLVRTPGDIERKLGLTVLGTIPRTVGNASVAEAMAKPRGQVFEAYSALRGALLYSTPEGLPRSLLVTSSQASEGKSTTGNAVATSMAKLGKRVVLVDADLRKPSLHRTLELTNEIGLSDLLVGARSLDEALVPVPDRGYTVLLSGPIPPSPTDLLGTGRLGDVIAQLEDRFDLVVLDGPPVLGLADAPMLAAQAEATLFVIEANRGYRGRTKGALRRLRGANANIVGALLTKFEARKAGVGQEYGYEYYSYGEHASTKRG